MFNSDLLRKEPDNRARLVAIAAKELGVREAGYNAGPRIEKYLSCAGLKRGQPYCASYISWVFKQAGYAQPRTGWSPDLFPASRVVTSALPGDVLGIYIKVLGRIGHVGLVERIHSDWVYGLEANTNNSGGREGDGVYRRMRHKRSIRKFADWIKQ